MLPPNCMPQTVLMKNRLALSIEPSSNIKVRDISRVKATYSSQYNTI